MRRKRFLRRATIGIASTGMAFFGALSLGHAARPYGAAGAPSLQTALAGGSLRIALPRTDDIAGMFPADSVAPGGESLPGARGSDLAAEQFAVDVRERLPRFRASFKQAGRRNGLDWRLLAAMGYQESGWDPNAVSHTGVRGIMMLTLDTAGDLEVDRDNPAESIRGAAEYFEQILEHLPPQIHEPDRTDMALAAYNQGFGHLLDARKLAAQAGRSPNRWRDLCATLPLLTDERWFSKTRHGYARGQEAVYFVSRVRGYYGMLRSITADGNPPLEVASSGT